MAAREADPDLLRPFLEHPERAGVLCDFDGTLSAIVDEPDQADALPGVPEALHRLVGRYGRVAVVSGRPVRFLLDRLDLGDGTPPGMVVAGLYGLQRATEGEIEEDAEARSWRPVVEEVAARADAEAPAGVRVERKGLSLTLHVRTAPELGPWTESFARAAADTTGLCLRPARLSWELVPPVPIDKGKVVGELVDGLDAACFMGDDWGDLPGFDALDRLAAGGASVLKVAVASDEAPAELMERADVVVDGPAGALDLLHQLAADA